MATQATERTVRERRTPPAGLGELLNRARLRAGYRLRECARQLGISPGYLVDLEAGRRCPSRTVAQLLADGLALTEEERQVLYAAAVGDAGRDNPMRRAGHAEAPGP